MLDCQTKTAIGNHLERGLKSLSGEIKGAVGQIYFIRRGVAELNDIFDADAGMDLLRYVEEKLDTLTEEADSFIKSAIELDEIASGTSLLLAQGFGEEEIFEAIQVARQIGSLCVQFMGRAALRALEVYQKQHKCMLPNDAEVDAVVEAVSADQTPEGVAHA